MSSDSALGLDGMAYAVPLLCALLALEATACHSPPDEPGRSETAAGIDDDTCAGEAAHDVPGRSCDEREAASCAPGTDPDSRASSIFSAILSECFLLETSLRVELERGCATRFVLSIEPPGSVECVGARLAAERYECLGDLTCGEGEVTTLR